MKIKKFLNDAIFSFLGVIGFVGIVNAMPAPYAICAYQGDVTWSFGGSQFSCNALLSAKVSCSGDMEIVAAGFVVDDAACPFLFVGNFPWVSNVAAIIAGGATINTDANGYGITSVNDAAGSPLAGGLLNGVGGSTSSAVACDTGLTVNVPDSIPISGTFSYTGANLGAPGLANLGCTPVF